ncbi:hypothetical protein EV127DRAFT_353042 [Xylaria flabelliformis]|nr:hypothetical protein EV127DRAFT_353042 [Xylaria flabelliformis]
MAPELTVEQLLALDKSGMVEFIKANYSGPANAIDITNIKDWDEVSESKRTELLQSFIEAYPIVTAPQLSDFFPDLVAKLNSIQSNRETLRESPPTSPESRERTKSPDPDLMRKFQTACYHNLVNEGGRPPCSLEALDQIYSSPTADVMELIKPWLDIPAPPNVDDIGVFSNPLNRWKEFRKWQRDNRWITMTADESLAAYRKEDRQFLESIGHGHVINDPEHNENVQRRWELRQLERWRDVREVKDGSFTEYVEAARRRLAKHGFHEAFRLLEDPERQDERATRIEYLEFECWWLDVNTRTSRRRKRLHDTAWEELVKSGFLRAGETEEDLFAPQIIQFGQEVTPRDKAIFHFMKQARPYRDAKAVESRQSLRVQWARSQIPKEPTTPKPARGAGKRRLHEDEEKDEGPLDGAVWRGPAAKKQKTEPERERDGDDTAAECT